MARIDCRKPVDFRRTEWKQIHDQNGRLLYEGFTFSDKPCGAGAAFFPDGTRYKEGLWGYKGLAAGREYYPNGQLRFEGSFDYNCGYGPNFPRYGRFYDENGELRFEGEFRISKSGLGWPTVVEPTEYGSVIQKEAPELHTLQTDDPRKAMQ